MDVDGRNNTLMHVNEQQGIKTTEKKEIEQFKSNNDDSRAQVNVLANYYRNPSMYVKEVIRKR